MKPKTKTPAKLPPLEITSRTMKKILAGENYQLVITSVIGIRDKEGKIKSAKVIIPKKIKLLPYPARKI